MNGATRFILSFCLLSFTLQAEEKWNPALLLQHPKPKGNFDGLVIPVKRANNLILVEAQVDDMVGFFIFDTGAPYLVLNQTYFRNFNLDRSSLSAGLAGGGGYQKTTLVDRLKIRELFYENLEAVSDFGTGNSVIWQP